MDERYQQAKKLFLAVCDLPPSEGAALLHKECGGDAGLQAEVESLLAHREPPTEWPSDAAVKMSPERGNGDRQHIGSYRVIRELGRGGMGVVYLGAREDDQFKRRAAIKVLKRGMDTEQVLGRFELERQLLAALNHPNIARLYDGGETDDGLPYFAMEYVEGLPLDEYCDNHRFRIAERLELFRAVCSAVHHAHQNLVVHRDLKPGNVLVTRDSVPKLLDFGIAKLINPELGLSGVDPTAPEFRVMTPEYASPEQVRGDPITTASDVYSLGVLLYELMSGHRPYRLGRRSRAEIEQVICEVDPENPSTAVSRIEEVQADGLATPDSTKTITPELVSKVREGRPDRLRKRLAGDIDHIVLMAMRKEPQRRYASAEQFADDIRRHLEGLPVIARRDTFGYRWMKFARRHRAGVAAVVVVALSLLVGIGATSRAWQVEARAKQAEREQRRIAEAERDRAESMFSQVRELARTFMFDFHDKIQKLDGSIPARELLVTTALEYLDGLAEQVGDDPELRRELASAYDRVGDIHGGIHNPSLGDTVGALENYQTALQLRKGLLAAAPDDVELQKEVSTSHIHIGDMLLNTGQVAEALAEYDEALRIGEALAKAEPMRRRHLAHALNNVGHALLRSGRLTDARRYYERSLAIRRQLAEEQPGDLRLQRDLSVGLIRMAGLSQQTGQHEDAIPLYAEAVAIRQRLLEVEPDSGRAKRDLAVARYYLGEAYLALDQPGPAMEHLEYHLNVARERAAANPTSARAQRDLAYAHEILGRAFAMLDDWPRALESYEEFQRVIIPLSESDPDNTLDRRLVSESYERLGEVWAATGDARGAVEHYAQALEIVKALAAADPHDVRLLADRARLLTKLGGALSKAGEQMEAESRLLAARDSYSSLVAKQPEDDELRVGLSTTFHELAKLMVRLNDPDAALFYAQKALDTAPRRKPSLLAELALALHLSGDNQRAIDTAEEALSLLAEAEPLPKNEALRQRLEGDLERWRQ